MLHTTTNHLAAHIFGIWSRGELGPVPARALLRHAFNHLFRHFCYVDLKGYQFKWQKAYYDTLRAFKQPFLRYPPKLQLLHVRRRYTTQTDTAPTKAYLKYEPFLHIDRPDGTPSLSNEFTAAIEDARKEAQT